jgi:hypothetical protein
LVEQADGSLMPMVIDPSLFSGPVSVDAWRTIQLDPTSRITFARSTMDKYLKYQEIILNRERNKLNVSPATAGP